jgi:hypothetical protein
MVECVKYFLVCSRTIIAQNGILELAHDDLKLHLLVSHRAVYLAHPRHLDSGTGYWSHSLPTQVAGQ